MRTSKLKPRVLGKAAGLGMLLGLPSCFVTHVILDPLGSEGLAWTPNSMCLALWAPSLLVLYIEWNWCSFSFCSQNTCCTNAGLGLAGEEPALACGRDWYPVSHLTLPSPYWTTDGLKRAGSAELQVGILWRECTSSGPSFAVNTCRERTEALLFGRNTLGKKSSAIIISHFVSMKQGFRQILALYFGLLARRRPRVWLQWPTFQYSSHF